jgi:L-alanine-DL-glutamate epimerase-like enolase superfamily enzyme
MILETGRNLLANWTADIITKPVVIKDGYMALPEGPGLGTALQEGFLTRSGLIVGTVS